jgi:beta-phosphoglucomutase-like phosphatase (HAD superfamily)
MTNSRDESLPARTAFLFDLDGILVDSVYEHELAWREALEAAGIHLAVWRIHRQIGMSGGLFGNALLRETGHTVSAEEAERNIAHSFLIHTFILISLVHKTRPRGGFCIADSSRLRGESVNK